MLARFTETFKELLENKHYGQVDESQDLTEVITLLNKFPDFEYDSVILSLKDLVIKKYYYREIGSETEELFLHRFSVKCDEVLLKFLPKVEMWLENFKDLFKFTVELKSKETGTFSNNGQNTYYLNPINASTGITKTVVVDEEHKTTTTTFSGGNLKVQDLDTNDTEGINSKETTRDVLQSVWGKTRANLLEQIMNLKDIYNDVVEEFNDLFMGLY